MIGLLIIAWITLGAWAYRDAQERCLDGERYPVLAQWSPAVWSFQVLAVPGFGLLSYIQARRPQLAEVPVSAKRWQVLLAPAGLMVLLVFGFLGGALTAIPTSKALNAGVPVSMQAPAYRVWKGERRLTADADKIRYTVLGQAHLDVITHATGEARAAGEFVIVRLGIRNESDRAEMLSPNRFALVDPAGRQYASSFTGETALLFKTGRNLSLEARQPGLESAADLVFDVPKRAGKWGLAVLPLDPLAQPVRLPLD